MSAITVAIANQKGGVGKSTIAFHLGCHLAQARRTLFIDLDPQANLTEMFADPMVIAEDHCIMQAFGDTLPHPLPVGDRLGINADLLGANIALSQREASKDQDVLPSVRWVVQELGKQYEAVIIDVPPTLGQLFAAGMIAADAVLIPVLPDAWSQLALQGLTESIYTMKRKWNPQLSVAGIVVNQVRTNTKDDIEIIAAMRNQYGPAVFDTILPLYVAIRSAMRWHVPVWRYKANSEAAKAYLALMTEIEGRIWQ